MAMSDPDFPCAALDDWLTTPSPHGPRAHGPRCECDKCEAGWLEADSVIDFDRENPLDLGE